MTDLAPGAKPSDTSRPARMGRFVRVADPMADERDGMLGSAIARAKQGDTNALHFLYVRYADDVYGFVNSIVRDHHEAEDITQNLFAKLMRIIGKYEQPCPQTLGGFRHSRDPNGCHRRKSGVEQNG
jgi:hypothetical protein